MKKIILLFALAIFGYGLQAQTCQANFSYTVDTSSYTVTFTDLSYVTDSSDYIVSWVWDFGDGTNDSLQNETHIYNTSGVYLVCLTITTAYSATSTFCDSVEFSNDTCFGFSVTGTVTPESSSGAGDGSVVLTVTGGTAPYSYAWSNGQNTQSIFNLSGGTYNVTVVDNNGCNNIQQFYVPEDSICAGFYFTATVTQQSYSGANDGAIDVTVYGGTSPINYNWSTGQVSEDITSLAAGQYCLTVTDSNACTSVNCFYIYQDSSSVSDTLTTTIIDSCINFIVDTSFINNYTWLDSAHVEITWEFQGSGQTATISVIYEVLQPGNYTVLISFNCGTKTITTYSAEIYIDQYTGLSNLQTKDNSLKLYPNPVNDYLTVSFQTSGQSVISIFNATGQLIRQFNMTNGNSTINVSNLQKGIYILRVETRNEIMTSRFTK